MAFKKKTEKAAGERINYDCKVIKAREISDECAAFDMKVNGVTIYGCFARFYTNAAGEEGTMITLPQYKALGKNNEPVLDENGKQKYYSHVFFPISKEQREDIIRQVDELLTPKE